MSVSCPLFPASCPRSLGVSRHLSICIRLTSTSQTFLAMLKTLQLECAWSLSLPMLTPDFRSCRSTMGHCVGGRLPTQLNRPCFFSGQPTSNLLVSFGDFFYHQQQGSGTINIVLLQVVSLMLHKQEEPHAWYDGR